MKQELEQTIVQILQDHGCTRTDVWGLSAQWIEQVQDLVLPFRQHVGGQFSLAQTAQFPGDRSRVRVGHTTQDGFDRRPGGRRQVAFGGEDVHGCAASTVVLIKSRLCVDGS